MPLPLMIHSALALFAQRTRIPTSARSIGFCVIWVCICQYKFEFEFEALETAGALPVSDPRRLEKTIIAPHIDLSAPPRLRSSIQNKAGTHQLALSALLGCPIAISAPSSDTYIQAHYGATDNARNGRSPPRV